MSSVSFQEDNISNIFVVLNMVGLTLYMTLFSFFLQCTLKLGFTGIRIKTEYESTYSFSISYFLFVETVTWVDRWVESRSLSYIPTH